MSVTLGRLFLLSEWFKSYDLQREHTYQDPSMVKHYNLLTWTILIQKQDLQRSLKNSTTNYIF